MANRRANTGAAASTGVHIPPRRTLVVELASLGIRSEGSGGDAEIPPAIRDYPSGDIERSLVALAEALGRPVGAPGGEAPGWLAGAALAWIGAYGGLVITEKLRKFSHLAEKALGRELPWVRVFAFYAMAKGHAKWRILARPIAVQVDLLGVAGNARLRDLPDEPWISGSGIRIPMGTVLPAGERIAPLSTIAEANRQVYLRVLLGAGVRADIVWSREVGARTPAESARIAGCSYAAAHGVWQGLKLLEALPASLPVGRPRPAA